MLDLSSLGHLDSRQYNRFPDASRLTGKNKFLNMISITYKRLPLSQRGSFWLQNESSRKRPFQTTRQFLSDSLPKRTPQTILPTDDKQKLTAFSGQHLPPHVVPLVIPPSDCLRTTLNEPVPIWMTLPAALLLKNTSSGWRFANNYYTSKDSLPRTASLTKGQMHTNLPQPNIGSVTPIRP